ncbi:hypothetical protein [Streptomyces sp. NPDC050988]|uniref:hypothetical protein n=1 Tax=Streptomyces sp. NPDC050988 TaxID=3365637 RepID=UPI00379F74B4
MAAAARYAAASGTSWLDTAPNYRTAAPNFSLPQSSPRHPRLQVAAKVGFVTPQTRKAVSAAGILPPRTHHSLHPRYVRWQMERNRHELGRDRIDTLLLHNPDNGRGPIADATARGWDVHASAPLHGGGLPHLATAELADLLHPRLSIAQAFLLAVASCPASQKCCCRPRLRHTGTPLAPPSTNRPCPPRPCGRPSYTRPPPPGLTNSAP